MVDSPVATGPLPSVAPAAIVGGGVIGLSIAYELLRRDPERYAGLVVVERGTVGCGASQAAAGMIAPQSEAEVQSEAVVAFGCDSARRYARFVDSVERASGQRCGYRQEGTLWVARDQDEWRELEHLAAIQQTKGVPARLVSAEEVRSMESHLCPGLVGGLRVDLDHQVDPRRLVSALAAAVQRLGGLVREKVDVRAVEREGHRWRVSARYGSEGIRVLSEQVVLAAGAWTEVDLDSPMPPIGLRPVKGQTVRLGFDPKDPPLRRVIRSPRVYLVPMEDGTLVVGATSEESGYDDRATGGGVMDLLRLGWRMLPALYDLPLLEVTTGLRPTLRDHQPAIGAVSANGDAQGLFTALGHYRDGVLLAPATAHYLTDLMCTGAAPGALEPFRPERFRSNVPAVRRSETSVAL